MSVQDMVNTALRNAADNDYNFDGVSAEAIALDLQSYDADLEKEDAADVLVAVVNWQVDQL